MNLVEAINYGIRKRSKILGIVGRDGGFLRKKGDQVVIVPTVNKKKVTPHVESFQAVIWHCLVSHPLLQLNKTKL